MMDHEIEPGSKDALYDEIRRRILRNQNRDRIDTYEEKVRDVRESVTRTSDQAGSILGSSLALWAAGILTVLFAGAAIFVALNPDWNQVPAAEPDYRVEAVTAGLGEEAD